MEKSTVLPCANPNIRVAARSAINLAGMLGGGLAATHPDGPTVTELHQAARLAERHASGDEHLPFRLAALLLRDEDPLAVACARNRAQGVCPMECDRNRNR